MVGVTPIEKAVGVANGAIQMVEVISTMADLGIKTAVTLVKAQIMEMKEITKQVTIITINSTLTEEWMTIADLEVTITRTIIIIIDLSLEANVVAEDFLMEGPHATKEKLAALNNATLLEKMLRGDAFSLAIWHMRHSGSI